MVEKTWAVLSTFEYKSWCNNENKDCTYISAMWESYAFRLADWLDHVMIHVIRLYIHRCVIIARVVERQRLHTEAIVYPRK